MLQAMRGILAGRPKLQNVVGPGGRQLKLVMADLLYHDGRSNSDTCRIRVMAWNEHAEHLAKYQAGDEIQFVGRLNAALNEQKQTELSFTIQRIDESLTLAAAAEQFLREFTPRKERLIDQIHHAEQQKERNESAGKESAQITHQPE